jgi:hypothetical protein
MDFHQSKIIEANYEILKQLKNQSISISTKSLDEEVVFVLSTPTASYVIAPFQAEDSPFIDLIITKQE